MTRKRRVKLIAWLAVAAAVIAIGFSSPALVQWYWDLAYVPSGRMVQISYGPEGYSIVTDTGRFTSDGLEIEGVDLDPRELGDPRAFDVLERRWEWLPGPQERVVPR